MTAQQETPSRTDDTRTPPVWAHEPDASDGEPNGHPSCHEEGESMEEPGYGHGV